MPVTISVDLASRKYSDFGIAVLTDRDAFVEVEFLDCLELGLTGAPHATTFAECLWRLAVERDTRVILLDGPHAWKDPSNGLLYQRICEKLLKTPGKTGSPGHVLPKPFRYFVEFSIDVFNQLYNLGGSRLMSTEVDLVSPGRLVLESFPTAAWEHLRMQKLPGKGRTAVSMIHSQTEKLCDRFNLRAKRQPNHDQLQALVSGLAGVAICRGSTDRYLAVGEPPILVDDIWREGFIILPTVT